ncbi:SDR family NAD(P)-dependent oxidoreductase [Arthrobacter sp. 08Y14]|uniref:SDR family NAD(P)-dependent oxidoreductase n=1 Tax=Arthrobacter sp. 08Y14 TaxID=2058885 RepID=UPI000CE422BA|nr:SDR family oxidoreductase [Arthrobacter sp. 08Y14]
MTTPDFGFRRDDAIIITGAGSGIGRATAVRASELGLRVSAWDLNADGLSETAAVIRARGGEVHTVVGDVTSEDVVQEGLAAARSTLGGLRYLHNNAGPSSGAPLAFDDALSISVGSVRRLTEAWAAGGLPDGAAMVVTTSVAGNLVGTEVDWYSASKAALMGYVRHTAAHRAREFRSNGVAPGMTDTPRLQGFADSERGKAVLSRIPLARMASPDDIAYAVLFLLSPLGSYINGVFLPVDGGWTITQ